MDVLNRIATRTVSSILRKERSDFWIFQRAKEPGAGEMVTHLSNNNREFWHNEIRFVFGRKITHLYANLWVL